MARKRTQPSEPEPVVTFEFENRTYQIDPLHRKVYCRFVEIETSRAAEVFSSWRAQDATA